MASGGAGPLKALKDKMQSLRDELDESREKFELAEKQLAAEKLEREKVLAWFHFRIFVISFLFITWHVMSYLKLYNIL